MLIHIVEPYYGAYVKYGWGDKIPGIGFKKALIDTIANWGEKVRVTIGKDKTVYEISPITIQNQAKKYNSIFEARYDTLLYVVPLNKLRKVKL